MFICFVMICISCLWAFIRRVPLWTCERNLVPFGPASGADCIWMGCRAAATEGSSPEDFFLRTEFFLLCWCCRVSRTCRARVIQWTFSVQLDPTPLTQRVTLEMNRTSTGNHTLYLSVYRGFQPEGIRTQNLQMFNMHVVDAPTALDQLEEFLRRDVESCAQRKRVVPPRGLLGYCSVSLAPMWITLPLQYNNEFKPLFKSKSICFKSSS